MKQSESNPCKERSCNACCHNMLMPMSLSELVKFTEKWRARGHSVTQLPKKSQVRFATNGSSDSFTQQKVSFSINRNGSQDYLQQCEENGKYANKIAQVLVEGLCPNNQNGECTIYEDRPQCCRNLEVEDKNCQYCREKTIASFVPVGILFVE